MRRRIHTQQKNTRNPTPELSTAPAMGMFQPRPFDQPAPTIAADQQPDLKTSLMQAERHGHHLSQMHDTDVSVPQVTQPKMGRGRSIHSEPAAQPSSARVQSSSGGRRLPKNVRQKMEAAFSTDFSNVNVHEGAQAAAIGADAYTQGNQIHFQPGKYNPTSQAGQQLLGHELTHVVQQRTGKVSATTQSQGLPVNDQPDLEAQADKLGKMAARGENVSGRIGGTVSRSGGMVQCKVEAVQCGNGKNGEEQERKRKRSPGSNTPGSAHKRSAQDASAHSNPPYSRRKQGGPGRRGRTEDNRVKNQDGKLIKHYAIPYDPDGNIVLPVKNERKPYNGERAFMGGLPNLPGGNMEKEHKSSTDTLDNEIGQELPSYKRVADNAPEFISSKEDERGEYNIHKVSVEPQDADNKKIPDKPEFREMMGRTSKLNPNSADFQNLDDSQIREHILKEANIDRDKIDPKSIEEFEQSHTIQALVEHLKKGVK